MWQITKCKNSLFLLFETKTTEAIPPKKIKLQMFSFMQGPIEEKCILYRFCHDEIKFIEQFFYIWSSIFQTMDMLTKGNKERTQEPTAANKTSSRSHAILQVTVKQRNRVRNIMQEVSHMRAIYWLWSQSTPPNCDHVWAIHKQVHF